MVVGVCLFVFVCVCVFLGVLFPLFFIVVEFLIVIGASKTAQVHFFPTITAQTDCN